MSRKRPRMYSVNQARDILLNDDDSDSPAVDDGDDDGDSWNSFSESGRSILYSD